MARCRLRLCLVTVVGLSACFSDEGASTEGGTTTTATDTGVPDDCGNGTTDEGEECDLAASNSNNAACTTQCLLNVCGDGFVFLGREDCDDGQATESCDSDCSFPACGDGVVNEPLGEACDNGADNGPGMACKEDCTPNECGDDDIGPDEECDNGELNGPGQACKGNCIANFCGDADVGPREGCDDGNDIDDDDCSNTCELLSCGDAMIQAPEECDDGKDGDNTDECTDLCKAPICGDGFVQPGEGEECDDGGDNGNSKACTAVCLAAACGDGFVWAGNEACDEGGQSQSCDDDCTPVECGDSNINEAAGEDCDDGNSKTGDGCHTDCTAYNTVFVTSMAYPSNFGGPPGADDSCTSLAANADLPGQSYKAWLSTAATDAAEHLAHSSIPYRLVNGTKVADNWNDLSDGTLDNNINATQNGLQPPTIADNNSCVPSSVWTGTKPDGTVFLQLNKAADCSGWIDNQGQIGLLGRVGRWSQTGSDWTSACSADCDSTALLYCFQQ